MRHRSTLSFETVLRGAGRACAETPPSRVPAILVLLLLALLFTCALPGRASAATPIVIDGEFSDWEAQAHLEDPYDDTKHHWDDVRYWYWGTNDGVSAVYFMVQRYEHHGQFYEEGGPEEEPAALPEIAGIAEGQGKDKKQVHYTIFVDCDNNGRFGEPTDAVVYADHYPKYYGFTLVSVFRGGSRYTYSGMWGDSDEEGGLRVEWIVTFQHLGIQPGQVLRLVLFAQDKRDDWMSPAPMAQYEDLVRRREADRIPDRGDLQWAPISTLGDYGWLALVAAGVAVPAILARKRKALG